MNCTDCTGKLDDYVDGTLSASEVRVLDAHLATCAACRRERDALRSLLAAAATLPREIAPASDRWAELRAELERSEPAPRGAAPPARNVATADARDSSGARRAPLRPAFAWSLPFAIAAAVALLFSLAERNAAPAAPAAWSVSPLSGTPRLAEKNIHRATAFALGEWLETDANSRAQVAVGSIGEVKLEPNSRLRLTGVGATDHRVELARGTLEALIWAPPRLFFVDTPSARAIDLGCRYTLSVADDGSGELRVLTGYVALEHGPRESIIPARAMCLMRRGAGPGTPFAEDAPAALRDALEQFDFTPGAAAAALPAILASARADDAVTLWHLLARTAGQDRAMTFAALAQHHAPPAGVTREGILRGDAAMRRTWAAELGLGTFATR